MVCWYVVSLCLSNNSISEKKNEILGQRGNVKYYNGSLLGYKIRQRWLKIEP